MNRSSQVARAVSAMRSSRAGTLPRFDQASMTFLVLDDNDGGYRWTLAAAPGERLAQSPLFCSYEQAARAARIARQGRLSGDRRTPHRPPAGRPAWSDTPPADLSARRRMAGERDNHPERWLDERHGHRAKEITPHDQRHVIAPP